MRININVPFAENANAKSFGARWDPHLRTWYVPDGVEDLTPFYKWFKGARSDFGQQRPSKKHKRQRVHAKPDAPAITKSKYVPHCGCYHVLPWEDCEHTAPDEEELDPEQRAHLRSILL